MFIGANLVPEPEQILRLQAVARGEQTADLAIRGGTVLALHNRELIERDVLIVGEHIAAVTPIGRLEADTEIDATDQFVAPTFIDVHLHIEYTMLTPGELARLVVPRGTTTVLADPNCLANVVGTRGADAMAATGTPMRIFQQISHKIPRVPDLELGGAVMPEADVIERLSATNVATLGESNPFDLDISAARKAHAAMAAGRRLTGHTARIADEPLWAYLAGGVSDDHNAFNTAEVIDRLRLGVMITVMSGSMNDNVPLVFEDVPAVSGGFDSMSFCADDRHVEDLRDEGHIDHHVRSAIAQGVPAIEAYRMGTLNAAQYYRLDHLLGSITPSRLADVMILDDLSDVRPSVVIVGGEIAGRDGEATFVNPDTMPDWVRNTVHLPEDFGSELFRVEADAAADEVAVVRAMEMYDGYFKRAIETELQVVDGNVIPDPAIDIAKITVFDRHHGTDTRATGFVRGFGLARGALGITSNCENQNLVVVGTSDEDLAHAARTLQEIGGGYVCVADGEVLATVPLPFGGIMSDQPWERVYDQSIEANHAAASIGCEIASPYMILAFVGLAGVPDYGLTEKGLIDTMTQSFIPVLLCCRCPQHIHHGGGVTR
ncbi:adenine deaminase C-terminal domain-containing protein [Candidatus Poriferisocius sp.]|uniref:adenine deaminase C-terminal domain-containing protein n=1 Tax=Candidatus Poriferisocius sp. TaxID=3101276 RepID=UPI003B522BC9